MPVIQKGSAAFPVVINTELLGAPLTLHSTWGLFSPRAIDDVAIDIGCGYGPLGLAIARQAVDGEVHMIDRDFVAIDYAKANARRNDINNTHVYLSNSFSAVREDLPLTLVVSNLPAKVGNELFFLTFHDAYRRMPPGARIIVVTIHGLRGFIKRAFTEVFGNYKKVKQGKSYTISMAVKQ